MIKIIISGTSNGFFPKYASDGVLNDSVSLSLLDRRRFFTRAADRLGKEGYCFQPLDQVGILFHKILPMSDGYGRDGFMMASIFLPKNEFLTGKEIKEALDSTVNDFKSRTINGMANFDIDWSFVKQKADELNRIIQNIDWKKLPTKNDDLCAALIKGADDHVADYFQYPNPLHKGFAGFGLVFLSEAILDPSKESSDGYQGYKVLKAEEVDIFNPEYQIELSGLSTQKGYEGARTITKKELLKTGNIPIGTYSKTGYRTAVVYIKDEEKNSKDNLTISVTLPDLVLKSATVKINLVDAKTGNTIPNYIIRFKDASNRTKSINQSAHGECEFTGEECDKRWSFSIDCGENYENYLDEIKIQDGKDIQETFKITPKTLWSIDFISPDDDRTPFKQDIPDNKISQWVNLSKEELKLKGLDIKNTDIDNKSHKVTLYCKRSEVDVHPSEGMGEADTNVGHPGTMTHLPEPKRNRYILKLNDNSRNYSLFRNYRKKREYTEQNSAFLKELEERTKELKNRLDIERFETYNEIISNIKDGDIKRAKFVFNSFQYSDKSDEDSKLVGDIGRIIKNLERQRGIPDVVSSSQDVTYDVTYNEKEHRLECERTECPSAEEPIKLNQDYYRYKISNPIWQQDNDFPPQKNVVRKELLPKYKTLLFAAPIVAILVVWIGVNCYRGHEDTVEDPVEDPVALYNQFKQKIPEVMKSCNKFSLFNDQSIEKTRYVGDSIYQELGQMITDVNSFIEHNDVYKESLQTELDNLITIYNKQNELKSKDSSYYNQSIEKLRNNQAITSCSEWLEIKEIIKDSALSQKHYEELQKLYDKRLDSDIKTLKGLCKTDEGKVKSIEQYFALLIEVQGKTDDSIRSNENEIGIKLAKIALNNNNDKADRILACKLYLKYWKKGRANNNGQIEALLNQLKSNGNSSKRVGGESENTNILKPDTISDNESLFKALGNVKAVKDGALKFNKIYPYSTRSRVNALKRDAKEIIDLAANLPDSSYSEIYNTANSEANPVEKLKKLKALLKQTNK